MTLLLLRNNQIPRYQSSNFVLSPSNYPGSGTMFFSNPICMFSWPVTAIDAGAADISVSVCLSSVEASSVIYKDPSHSNNALISFVLLELIMVLPCSFSYMCIVSLQVTLSSFIRKFVSLHLSCKVSLLTLYQMLRP